MTGRAVQISGQATRGEKLPDTDMDQFTELVPPAEIDAVALLLGEALYRQGDYATAAEHFAALIARMPDDAAPRLNLVGALLALGEDAEALRVARQVRLHAPGNPQAQYMLGLACLATANLGAFLRLTG